MLSLRHLKAIVLIVGVLVGMFGLYAAFHADESYGHGSNPVQKTNRDVTTTTVTTEMSSTVTCPGCNKEKRTKTKRRREIEEIFTTTHFHLNKKLKWILQSTYTYIRNTTKTDTYWSDCPNKQCGG